MLRGFPPPPATPQRSLPTHRLRKGLDGQLRSEGQQTRVLSSRCCWWAVTLGRSPLLGCLVLGSEHSSAGPVAQAPVRMDRAAAVALAWDVEACGLWADSNPRHFSGARSSDGKAGTPEPPSQLPVWREAWCAGRAVHAPSPRLAVVSLASKSPGGSPAAPRSGWCVVCSPPSLQSPARTRVGCTPPSALNHVSITWRQEAARTSRLERGSPALHPNLKNLFSHYFPFLRFWMSSYPLQPHTWQCVGGVDRHKDPQSSTRGTRGHIQTEGAHRPLQGWSRHTVEGELLSLLPKCPGPCRSLLARTCLWTADLAAGTTGAVFRLWIPWANGGPVHQQASHGGLP